MSSEGNFRIGAARADFATLIESLMGRQEVLVAMTEVKEGEAVADVVATAWAGKWLLNLLSAHLPQALPRRHRCPW